MCCPEAIFGHGDDLSAAGVLVKRAWQVSLGADLFDDLFTSRFLDLKRFHGLALDSWISERQTGVAAKNKVSYGNGGNVVHDGSAPLSAYGKNWLATAHCQNRTHVV